MSSDEFNKNANIPQNSIEYIVDEVKLYRFLLKFLIFLPSSITVIFLIFYPVSMLKEGLTFLLHLLIWLIPIIVLHEGLHALVWGLLSWKWKYIRFGFNLHYLSFYTTCAHPIPRYVYLLGGIAPFVILAIIPCVYGFIQGKFYWVAFSIYNALTCTADLFMCYQLLILTSGVLILDHPEKLGFYIIPSEQ